MSIRRMLQIVAVSLALAVTPTFHAEAQVTETDRAATQADDDGGGFGWIGILGLVGLAGLMGNRRSDTAATRHASTAPAR